MENIKQRRERFEQLGKLYPKVVSVKTEQASINGVNCYWVIPENTNPNKIIIHLHGGVYAVGSIHSHESLMSHIAEKLKTSILFIDYALSPEKPYPSANNDIFSVYKTLLNNYPGSKISFIGDSAGGGLIVSLVGELLNQKLILPQAVVMISPWIDLKSENPSQETNREKDPVLNKEYLKIAAKDYAGSVPIETANPEHVVLSKFPPVLIVVGSNEVLLDDSINFFTKVEDIQKHSTLTIYDKQNHVWPLADINSEPSQQLLFEMEEFFND